MIAHSTFEALLPFEDGLTHWQEYNSRKLESMRASGWLAGTPTLGYTITYEGRRALHAYRVKHWTETLGEASK